MRTVSDRAPLDGACNARDHGLVGDGETNDQPAFAALVEALGAAVASDGRPRVIYCPPGVYAMKNTGTRWYSGVSLVGAGPGVTRFVLANPGNRDDPTQLAHFTTQQHGAGRDNHIADVTFAEFEIDGSGVELPEYDPLAKGLGLQYVLRGRFRSLYIHGTAATGFGCDFLQDTVVRDITVVGCGRMDTGEQPGGAGIGIGIGGWGLDERLTVTGCTARANGTNGIFVELQREYWPPPRGIQITDCHAEGNRFGISDWGAQGLIVSACTLVSNCVAGFDVSSQGTSGVGGRGGLLTSCVIDANLADGVSIGNTPGPYTARGNRISNNGGCGYREHNLARDPEAASEITIESNDVFGNGLDGIRLEAETRDALLVANRVRNNGRRCAPAASGGGRTVTYTETALVDEAACWPEDGHRGKPVRVDERSAIVLANTPTELRLAPERPQVEGAWPDGVVPVAGSAYVLPGAPDTRAGIVLDAAADEPTIRANRVWDNQRRKTQTHGLWITPRGTCRSARVADNDLVGNAAGALRCDTAPSKGRWDRNLGVPPLP